MRVIGCVWKQSDKALHSIMAPVVKDLAFTTLGFYLCPRNAELADAAARCLGYQAAEHPADAMRKDPGGTALLQRALKLVKPRVHPARPALHGMSSKLQNHLNTGLSTGVADQGDRAEPRACITHHPGQGEVLRLVL